MDDTRHRLIAWALGELSPEEYRALVPMLSDREASEELEREHRQLERTLNLLRNMPSDDASDALVQRVLAAAAEPQHEIVQISWFRRALPRVAAAAAIIFVLGAGVWFTPGGLQTSVGEYTDGGLLGNLLEGEPLETRVGETRHLKFATGEVLLDGATTVRMRSTGEYSAPVLEVERGRVVVTAANAPMEVVVANRTIVLQEGAVLAVNYDRAYANIPEDGLFVEIQRVKIGDVAELAERAYGIQLDTSAVPQNVRDIRVTFYGSDLNSDKFLDSLADAVAVYGLRLDEDRRALNYRGASGPVKENDEWQLDLAVLQGSASLGNGVTLDEMTNFVSLSAGGKDDARRLGLDELQSQVVWATGTAGAVREHLPANVRQSGDTLPGGTVIYADKMVLHGEVGKRIYKLGASEYDYVLPGGRKARVVQLMNSGAVFETQGELVREFVPFGQ
jgi:hypothetical protein